MDAPAVRYVKTTDGYDIAFTICGDGPPLVLKPPNFSSVQTVWHHYPELMQGLAARFHLISYDSRGEGLSTRGLPDGVSMEDFGTDLATVIERLELQNPILFTRGMQGHNAVRYALSHPGQVRALIWNTAAIRVGPGFSSFFMQLARENWELFLASLARGLPVSDQQQRINDYRNCVTIDDWSRWTDAYVSSMVEAELPHLVTPTLVFQSADYATSSQEESIKVAALIPAARFVSTTGAGLYGDADQCLAAIDAFLQELPSTVLPIPETVPLSAREFEVLRLLAAGKSNAQIADELVISLNTVRKHVSNIFDKIGVANRAQSAVYAKEHGLV